MRPIVCVISGTRTKCAQVAWFVNDKGRYRQFVSGYGKRLHKSRFRRSISQKSQRQQAKDIPIEVFLTLASFIMHYPDEEATAREDETEAMGEHEGGSRNPGPIAFGKY